MTAIRIREPRMYLPDDPQEFTDTAYDGLIEQPCPACRGRADSDCRTCGGEGYV